MSSLRQEIVQQINLRWYSLSQLSGVTADTLEGFAPFQYVTEIEDIDCTL